MRDLALIAIVLAALPFVLKRPFYGLLLWVWFSIMNPHRLAYGFAFSFPFALLIAAVTLLSVMLHTRDNHRFPVTAVTFLQLLFVLWICVSPLFSFHPEGEWDPWLRAIKIQIMVLIAFVLVGKREELHLLTWVLAVSIGFFGFKGGLFTIANGGSYRVFGPESSFIADNNSLALAVIMAVPLFRYLQLHSSNRWVRYGCVLTMLLCVAASIGSQSRGALIALIAMGTFLWLKSPNKAILGVLSVIVGIAILLVAPENWSSRMGTIGDYQEDESAQGRINAWSMAWNLALSRFPIGGGFEIYTPELFARFAPVADAIHAAHSIYFQVLGEHGFIGLFIFLALFVAAWHCGNRVIAKAKNHSELRWARDLAAMLQTSLIGYAVGGAFLSLTYYDFPYYVASMLAITRVIVDRETKTARRTELSSGEMSAPVAAAAGNDFRRPPARPTATHDPSS